MLIDHLVYAAPDLPESITARRSLRSRKGCDSFPWTAKAPCITANGTAWLQDRCPLVPLPN